MASAIIGGLVAAGKELWGFMYPTIKSIVKFQSNLETLRNEMQNLEPFQSRTKEQIEAAVRSGHVPAPIIAKWLQDFEEIKSKVDSIEASMNSDNKCPSSCCLRFTLGVKVGKSLIRVKRLIEASNFPSGMLNENFRVETGESIPGPSIPNLSTASKNLSKVFAFLNDDGVSRIGVWGMGGVGKTTLAKNLNNQLVSMSEKLFSTIIWATASKESDLRRLQTQLLERLNLEVRAGESMESTASRLLWRLQRENRVLLILDDVWKSVDLDYLGIPPPESHRGHKILITTRFLDVCRQMKTDAEVKVNVLNEEESWQLFTQNAGSVANLEHIQPTAWDVCKECGGLPLAIIVVASSMRGKQMFALWEDALNALRRSVPPTGGIEETVHKSLILSYDSLNFPDTEINSCFLYCSLYPEDFSIEVRELVQCWIGEGLVSKIQNYEDSVKRGITMVEYLKDSCLLEDGIFKDTVKMHDVIRDVAIWIASSSKVGFKSLVQSGIGLKQISEVQFAKDLKRISLIDNNIKGLPDCSMQCPQLSSLLLQANVRIEIVPEGFLVGFKGLKVLNLSETCIRTLPHSLGQLSDLQTLLLRGCQELKELPQLGGLHMLQVLDCSRTGIESLPEGMENLTNLRLLDLSETHCLRHIPRGTISQLSYLEIIDMTNSSYEWCENIFDELGCLDRLRILCIHLKTSNLLNQQPVWVERLKRFHFLMQANDPKNLERQKFDERKITLGKFDGGPMWLLKKSNCLVLEGCKLLDFINTCFRKEDWFWGLKFLNISNCKCPPPRPFKKKKKCPPASAGSDCLQGSDAKFDPFPNLEELVIRFVNVRSISELLHQLGGKFLNLRTIKVSNCNFLNYLFSYGDFVPTLENLKEVTVKSCTEIIGLFELGSSPSWSSEGIGELDDHATSTSTQTSVPHCIMPNLQVMKLKNLPELTDPCGQHPWQHLEQLVVINCRGIKKLPFTSQDANRIKEIRGEWQWWNQLEWDDHDSKSRLQQSFIPVDAECAAF